MSTSLTVRISFIIPTRNRPDLLERALLSLLRQVEPCFEIIVSDNSDEESAHLVRQIVDRVTTHSVRYLRPNAVLSMTDHWDWAIGHAEGDYVGILTDRMMLKPYGTALIKQAVQETGSELIYYLHDVLDDDISPCRFKRTAFTGKTFTLHSEPIIELARNGIISRAWPRMLNSVCSTSALNEMRKEYGTVFSGEAPDYGFCFRALDMFSTFTVLDARILISSGKQRSNGGGFIRGKVVGEAADFIALGDGHEILSRNGFLPWTSRVPYNIEILEYQRVRLSQRSGRFGEVCKTGFYEKALLRVLELKRAGVDTSSHECDLESFRKLNSIGVSQKLFIYTGLAALCLKLQRRVKTFFGQSPKRYVDVSFFETLQDAIDADQARPLYINTSDTESVPVISGIASD